MSSHTKESAGRLRSGRAGSAGVKFVVDGQQVWYQPKTGRVLVGGPKGFGFSVAPYTRVSLVLDLVGGKTGSTNVRVVRAAAKPGARARLDGTVRPPDPAAERRAAFAEAVVQQLSRRDPSGKLLAAVDPDELADRLVEQVDTAPLWSEHLGPVYSSKSVGQILGTSKRAVLRRAGLLRMKTGDGTVVYPAFQFEGTRQIPGVAPIVAAARNLVSDWTLGSWFATPNDELMGKRPIDAIRDGWEDEALAAAKAWLGRMAA